MRFLAIILWLLLGFFYWWVWDSGSGDCCGADGMSGTKTEQVTEAPAALTEAERLEKEKEKEAANSLAAEKAAIAIEKAETTNEVTAVKSTDASGARKLTFYFPYNSPNAKYSAGTENDLKDLIDYAKSSGKQITITGHTDSRGDPENNMILGQQRADQVKNRLQSGGLSSGQISAKSDGQTNPIASNSTAEGRQQNRRVELIIQ